MRRPLPPGMPVVVKVGSSSLTEADGTVSDDAVESVVAHVAKARELGHSTVLVTSGAVAAGLPALGLRVRPADLPGLQAAAAVGQSRLMERYTTAFARRNLVTGQVLLTRDVLATRSQYLHARSALERMLMLGVVPIVNENDTVVVDELKLGDNDRLAAIVSHLVAAGLLVILTDTAGLYADDPKAAAHAELLTAVRHTDEILDRLWRRSTAGRFGSGGPATKVAAARMAAWSGIPTVIASASEPHVVERAMAGADVGTWVAPREARLTSRKLWIAFGMPAEGKIVVDEGAVRALVSGGKSLLPAGVVGVEGEFVPAAAVEVVDGTGGLIGKGITGIGSADLTNAAGRHSTEVGGVVIHRDDLVVLRA